MTGILWWFVFRKNLFLHQWISLFILMIGCTFIILPHKDQVGGQQTMYCKVPGLIVLGINLFLTACVGN